MLLSWICIPSPDAQWWLTTYHIVTAARMINQVVGTKSGTMFLLWSRTASAISDLLSCNLNSFKPLHPALSPSKRMNTLPILVQKKSGILIANDHDEIVEVSDFDRSVGVEIPSGNPQWQGCEMSHTSGGL